MSGRPGRRRRRRFNCEICGRFVWRGRGPAYSWDWRRESVLCTDRRCRARDRQLRRWAGVS